MLGRQREKPTAGLGAYKVVAMGLELGSVSRMTRREQATSQFT